MYKLAILTSHPIQYQAPLFRAIAKFSAINLLVCFRKRGSIDRPTLDKGFGIPLKWDVPLLGGYPSVFLNTFFGFLKCIRNFSPHAVLVYGWGSLFNKLALFFLIRKKIPIFIYGETPLIQEKIKVGFIKVLKRYLLKKLFKRASAFLYIGHENKAFYEYMGVPKDKLFFAPYAVENLRFLEGGPEENRELLRSQLGIKKEDLAILFVGKLISKKRPFDLIKSFELLTSSLGLLGDVHLLFVGDGPLRLKLQSYVDTRNISNISFLGFKNQSELPEYYRSADILVLPSGLGETWGLVINEAMCASLPIIASNIVGSVPDLVRDGENGFVFKMGNIEELKEKIILLLDSQKRKEFGEKSKDIISDYTYEKDVAGIINALASLNKQT